MEVEKIIQDLQRKHPGEPEYIQAVKEVLISIKDVYNQHPEFEKAKLIERLVEPERVITFRVPWTDDKHPQFYESIAFAPRNISFDCTKGHVSPPET